MADGMTDKDKSSAFVYKQSPSRGSGRIHLGEEVDLWLAKEMPDNIEVHPEWYNSTDDEDTLGN
jgi:hypothetical protein